jgi:hypothetical protein
VRSVSQPPTPGNALVGDWPLWDSATLKANHFLG